MKSFNKISVFLTVCVLLSFIMVNAVSAGEYRVDKKKLSVAMPDNYVVFNPVFYTGPAANFITTTTYTDAYTIGPEIRVVSGFYDWQTNGDCKRQIGWVSNNIFHTAWMTSYDSLDVSNSRRTFYRFSTDGGATWSDSLRVPDFRSGFCYLTWGNTGNSNQVAIIGNHSTNSGGQLTTSVGVDLLPGIGVFTVTHWNVNTGSNPTNHIWPQVNTLTNGNVLVGAQTYQGAAATDTPLVALFNPNTNAWVGSAKFMLTPATVHTNMRWASATGPGGKAVYIVDAINDVGGTAGGNRIFYFTSTDNGANWSTVNTLFDSYIDPTGDTVTAWLGLDAVYDNAGNWYCVFNTIADSFQTAKIWISKNGTTPKLVARNQDIPGAAWALTHSQANAVTMDWPSVAVSDDGQYVFVAYSVMKQDDTVNTFQSYDIYYSVALASNLEFNTANRVQVTSGIDDERYAILNRLALTDAGNTYVLHVGYQKDPQPGSSSFSDNAPLSRAALVYRKITQAQIIGIQSIGSEIPRNFRLYQNYPNPFNPQTTIKFDLPVNANVTLKIYDILGRVVMTIADNEYQSAGVKEVRFNASNLPSGVYFYSITAGDFSDSKKMVVVK